MNTKLQSVDAAAIASVEVSETEATATTISRITRRKLVS